MTDRVGQQLGNYRLLRLLGHGGFADVYLGEHVYLQSQAALKLLHSRLSEEAAARFVTEARTLVRLSHPHIVRVLDFAVHEGLPFLVMEYAPGGTLRMRHPGGSRLPLATIVSYVRQVASALQYAHEQHLMHRDVKPENLLLGAREEVLLADFGLAMLAPTSSRSTQAMEPSLNGTTAYLAPEQLQGKPQPASDQYALGVVVYEWLCGRRPFGGSPIKIAMQQLSIPPASLREQAPELPPAVEEVVLRALAKEPRLRFACVQDFANALQQAAQQVASPAVAPGAAAEVPYPARAAAGPPAALTQEQANAGSVTTPTVVTAPQVEREEQETPADTEPPAPLWNVPSSLTPLVGREQDVTAACALLSRQGVRLVTLLGAGGIGKTRLALQVALEMRERYADGVCFVALASISDPGLVISSIAHELGLQEGGAQPLVETMKTWLRDKQFLLLLDNFEQLVSAAPLLAELLAACPKLAMVVTSREVLHLRAEHRFPVPPLALPDLAHLPEREQLAQYAAVALFVQRAQAILPDFQLIQAQVQAIAEICVRLDGLPLALELAAARMRLLPPQALLARLSQRFQVLTGGWRSMPERQQTLRNTIQWSYDLLTAEEQRLFRWLAVFVGGCTLEAAEAVVHMGGKEANDLGIDVLEGVSSLIDKSLLQQTEQEGGEPRLSMLETLREYGLECLRERGEAEAVQRAHALYYLALIEQAEPCLQGTQQLVWLTRLEQEMANVLAALEAAYAYGMDAELVRGVNIFARFLETRGLYEQAEVHLERAQQAATSLQDRAGLATTLCFRGELAEKHGQYAHAEAYLQQGLELARQVRDQARICDILRLLGVVASRRGNYVQEGGYLEEGLALARQLNDHERISGYVRSLGVLAGNTGNYSLAEAYFQKGLALARQAQDVPTISVMLSNLGHVARVLKHYEQAAAYLQEGLVLARQAGHRQHESVLLATLGELAMEQRNDALAESYLREGLAIARQIGHAWFISVLLIVWGEWYLQQHQFDAASTAFEEALEQAPEGSRESMADALYGLARVALAQGKSERARQQGQESLAIFEAIGHHKAAEVRQWLNSGPDAVSRVRQPTTNEKIARTSPAGLTAREVEVLRLVVQGLTDAQMADQLVISPRTVNWHLTAIYSKLRVTSRSAATRYALEHHLV